MPLAVGNGAHGLPHKWRQFASEKGDGAREKGEREISRPVPGFRLRGSDATSDGGD